MAAAHDAPFDVPADRLRSTRSAAPSAPLPGGAPAPTLAAAAGEGTLGDREIQILTALAEAALPAGAFLPGGGAETARAVARATQAMPPIASGSLRGLLWALELGAVPLTARPFSRLSVERRARLLEGWEHSPSYALRNVLRAALTAVKFEHFYRREVYEHFGCAWETPAVRPERPRWMAQVTDGREVDEDLELECEVVVVGTGAGGAAAAYELARRGRAVLMLEEGDYHGRETFRRPQRAYQKLYRDFGLTMALGPITIPVWAGRAVGGSTLINSGTCYRAPERTLSYWRSRYGLPADFSSEGLDPYYQRVESMLGVAPAERRHAGVIADIIARGADRLGLSHHVLDRNAPGCDGQGVCCFGCPTGAKRSTDVSYVPEALLRGAQLVTAARVTNIDVVAGRARGVRATLGRPTKSGSVRRLTVRADAVVIAGGALMTPVLLKQARALHAPMLGKNLSIHPASKVLALFAEQVDQYRGIPQSYTIDHHADDDILFEGGSLPPDVASLAFPWTGQRFIDAMERYRHLATFGFMIKDHSRGEVRVGPGGRPLITYRLNQRDTALLQRGIETLCEVFQEAGAERVLPLVYGHDEVTTKTALSELRARRLRPTDFEVTAYHPLGTCRVGTDPQRSCLGPDHEAHEVESLYVCDGSAIPSSLGVNPQMTIMAMALRAAEIIDSRL